MNKLQDKVRCEICNKYFKQITHKHLKKNHNTSIIEYKNKFPRAKITSQKLHNKLIQRKVWNKGLTKETDSRIKKYGQSGSKTIRKQFKDGRVGSNKGRKFTDEWIENLKISHTGYIPTKEQIAKQKKNAGTSNHKSDCRCCFCQQKRGTWIPSHAGKTKKECPWLTGNTTKGRTPHNKGKRLSKEGRIKLSLAHGGNGKLEGSPQYALDFNAKLKEKIRKRDDYTCQECGITEEEHIIVFGKVLTVHHIDYDKQNSKETNLITLCNTDNIRANYNREYWEAHYKEKMLTVVNTY